MYSDLNDFIADLDRRRLLARVVEAVSPDLEIAAVTDRACKTAGGGPALLFETPAGYDIPVGCPMWIAPFFQTYGTFGGHSLNGSNLPKGQTESANAVNCDAGE